uniref:Uncharacterized protein n=1 Tax=Ornithodoros turicata TaxID=34597 RepID=A0A2R5LCP4_9ACAR
MRLQHKPRCATRVITACAALHNLGCLRKEPDPTATPSSTALLQRRSCWTQRTKQPARLPPVDAEQDSMTGRLAREILIQRCSFQQ